MAICMPIYFIHIYQRGRLAEDKDGKHFPNLKAAELEAIQAAREMGAQIVRAGKVLDLASRLEIVDANGRLASVVTFRDAIPIRNLR
jgi:uncharacterized protein DUF6894